MPILRDFVQKLSLLYKNQRQCKKCFMNGKSCIYQKDIAKDTFPIEKNTNKIRKAFMLMPFRTILNEIYRTQFEPCLSFSCKDVMRADDVMMTGYVICEKICKQIQESPFIIAEISFDNPNVFYELGLAYALNKNIAIFLQNNVLEGRRDTLRKLKADADDSCNLYEPFSPIDSNSISLWNTFETIIT